MEDVQTADISYRVSGELSDDALNGLLTESWPEHRPQKFGYILEHSLAYVTAYHDNNLIAFVNLAWDGGEHAFLLDTIVHPDFRRRGIGTEIVKRLVAEAKIHHIKWVHVDYEPHLGEYYAKCGFRHTEAGLIRLSP